MAEPGQTPLSVKAHPLVKRCLQIEAAREKRTVHAQMNFVLEERYINNGMLQRNDLGELSEVVTTPAANNVVAMTDYR